MTKREDIHSIPIRSILPFNEIQQVTDPRINNSSRLEELQRLVNKLVEELADCKANKHQLPTTAAITETTEHTDNISDSAVYESTKVTTVISTTIETTNVDRTILLPNTTTLTTVITTPSTSTTTTGRTLDPYDNMIAILRNKVTHKVLDSNTNKHVYTLNHNGGNYQKWIFIRQYDGTYVLRNIATSFILDSNNKKVYTKNFNGGTYQKWKFHRQNDGSYVLQNLATSRVLDSNGISEVDSVDSNVPDNQKWFLEGK